MAGVYLLNSHRELYERLTNAPDRSGAPAIVARHQASRIVYLRPPWPDAAAERPRASELARLFVFSQHDEPISWAPGMYASLSVQEARRGQMGGFYVSPGEPLHEPLEAAASSHTSALWSFVGTVENAPVRARIAGLRDPEAIVRDTSRFSDDLRYRPGTDAGRRAAELQYVETLARSLFVLCPRGRGLSSMRIFEAMQVGRCPVIVSDGWLEPPFVAWQTCSLRIAESQVEKLPQILRDHAGQAQSFGQAARAAWEQNFSPARRLRTLLQAAASSHRSPIGRLGDAGYAFTRPTALRIGARRLRGTIR